MTVLWSARSRNAKTGDVPTAWIGATKSETRGSCDGCKLLGNVCYAHTGTPSHAAAWVRKASDRGVDKTLASSLAKRAASARMVRVSAIGDIGRIGADAAATIVSTVKASGLALVGYTHHWRETAVADAWKGRLLASCDTLADADRAVADGWRAAVVLPADVDGDTVTPDGRTVKLCPAMRVPGKVVCNTCRLCDGSKRGPIIGFAFHGNSVARSQRVQA